MILFIGFFFPSSMRLLLMTGIALRCHVPLVSFNLAHLHNPSLSFITSVCHIQLELLLIFKFTHYFSSITPFFVDEMCKGSRISGDDGVGKELIYFYSTYHLAVTLTFIILIAILRNRYFISNCLR